MTSILADTTLKYPCRICGRSRGGNHGLPLSEQLNGGNSRRANLEGLASERWVQTAQRLVGTSDLTEGICGSCENGLRGLLQALAEAKRFCGAALVLNPDNSSAQQLAESLGGTSTQSTTSARRLLRAQFENVASAQICPHESLSTIEAREEREKNKAAEAERQAMLAEQKRAADAEREAREAEQRAVTRQREIEWAMQQVEPLAAAGKLRVATVGGELFGIWLEGNGKQIVLPVQPHIVEAAITEVLTRFSYKLHRRAAAHVEEKNFLVAERSVDGLEGTLVGLFHKAPWRLRIQDIGVGP